MLLSYTQISGYKEVVYEDIPKDFDESTQYITQKKPDEKEDHIFIGIEIHELEVDENAEE